MKALKEHRRLLAGIGLAALLLSFALIKWRQLDAMTLLRYLLLLAAGYCASLSDLRERLVPNVLMLLMLAAWVLWMGSFALVRWEEFLRLLLQSLAGGLVLGLAALVVYLLSRKGLGGGGPLSDSWAGAHGRDTWDGAVCRDGAGSDGAAEAQRQGRDSAHPVFVCGNSDGCVFCVRREGDFW